MRKLGIGMPRASNDYNLVTENPELAAQWHPSKNGDLAPEHVAPGSDKSVWWQCAAGHEWEAKVDSRNRLKRGCKQCKSLSALNPELTAEWHPTKNYPETPASVSAGSNVKRWWRCDQGHEWESTASNRSIGRGCPYCSGHKVSEENSLANSHPELVREWHPTKNGSVRPSDVSKGSGKKAWWLCENGHEWESVIGGRVQGVGCPYCTGKKTDSSNSLAAKLPELSKEWDTESNRPLSADQVTAGSNKRVWWVCREGHRWEATVAQRSAGSRCPYCSGRRATTSTSLAARLPEMAGEWHPSLNGGLTPAGVTCGSDRKVWWQCKNGHQWQCSPRKRTRECPECVSLKTREPGLATEWHPSKNGSLTPNDVVPGSGKNVWWQCSQAHEWQAVINKRSVRGDGCPICRPGWSIAKLKVFVASLLPQVNNLDAAEMYVVCQQAGLLKLTGKGAALGKKLASGRLPKTELEKFAAGKKSSLDGLVEGLEEENDQLDDFADEEADELIGAEDLEGLEAGKGKKGKKGKDRKEEPGLPAVSAGQALQAASTVGKIMSATALADQEAAEFLIASALQKIWKHAFRDEQQALREVETYEGQDETYDQQIKDEFLRQYQAVKALQIPKGYDFRTNSGELIEPNLMQRLVANRVLEEKRVGNWSGTGAGKTLSAILASRVTGSKLNVVCCPNSVVKGWGAAIKSIYPDSIVQSKNMLPPADAKGKALSAKAAPVWLILNYELFQQPSSSDQIHQLLEGPMIDMIVIDEIHYAKQRSSKNMSLRKQRVGALISQAGINNPELKLLGMSATPVINNLQEGKGLVEMISGLEHAELHTKATVPNAMALHQALARQGLRWMPEYDIEYERTEIEVDCSDQLDELQAHKGAGPMMMERLLTEARLPVILKNIQPKTLIYTHYIGGDKEGRIDQTLIDAIEADGWTVGLYTGDDKTGLERFIDGDLDVLIGTASIGTGVDGLQHVCSKLIFNALPWTHAEFEQIKGRLYRQGQREDKVEIVIPVTYALVDGEEWSWCKSRLQRLEHKKSIADCAVDGIVPEAQLASPEKVTQHLWDWLDRLTKGNVGIIERRELIVPLPPPSDEAEKKQRAAYGDFSKMNAQWNRSKSASTNARLSTDPTEWQQYHTLYREARQTWTTVPYKALADWCQTRGPDMVVGDFGCGEALIAQQLIPEGYTVHSFDHVAINDNVIACDVSQGVPLEDSQLDTALFSLSLMGANFTDYLKEAHRCLHVDGNLWIVEATSRFSNTEAFCDDLHKLGFDLVGEPEERGQFTFIRALKAAREPQAELKLKF